MILAHISDPHIGEGPMNSKRLHQLAQHFALRAAAGEDIVVVLTGDCTHDGLAEQWAQLHWALSPLGKIPLVVVPGNHDVGHLGIEYDVRRAALADRELEKLCSKPERSYNGLKVWTVDGHKLVGLNTCQGNAGGSLPPLARGQVGHRQIAALEVELQDEVPTIVLGHHHFLWSDWAHELEDAEEIMRLLDRRPHVEFVLYGHRHLEGRRLRSGTEYLASRKVTHLVDGAVCWREVDLKTGKVERLSLHLPA